MSGSPLDDVDVDAALDKEQWLQGKQAAHEDRVVRFVLNSIGKPGLIPELRRRGRELSGSSLLHFGLFYEVISNFPIWIGARHVPFAYKELQLQRIQQGFTKLRIWDAYLDVRSDVPRGWDGPVGVIFRAARMQGAFGAMILHDDTVSLNDHWLQKKVRDKTYTIESLVQFLDRLKTAFN
jgi:hypothetical protein